MPRPAAFTQSQSEGERNASLKGLLRVAVGAWLSAATVAHAAVFRTGQPVMGTVLQVTVVADDDGRARALCTAAVAAARHWDDVLTTWRAEGELARLNARAGAGPVAISADLALALRRMVQLSAETGGAFDPAVGPLVERWRGASPPAPPPTATSAHRIASALTLDGQQASLMLGAALDAGGIGKGLALDAIAQLLRRGGATAAFLDFGGSSQLAIGAPPDAPKGWRVALSGLAPNSLLGSVTLRDTSLSTSRASAGGSAAGPILDPRSGLPVFAARLATVRAADATSADAWSTALIVLGRDGLEAAAAHGVAALLVDAQGSARSGGFDFEALDAPPPADPAPSQESGLPASRAAM